MPYVCENSRLRWADDDEPAPPKVSDFVYVPARDLGGPSGPARLRIPTGSEPINNEEFDGPQEARALHLALKASGIAKVYCRYDGGNDEGFAWLDHAELGTGERLEPIAVAERLVARGVPLRRRMFWEKDWPEARVVRDMLDFPLSVNWAAALLGGRGFGTGEYSMYGAFVVDLVAETITDDPQAIPVIRNIKIEGGTRASPRIDPAEIKKASEALASAVSIFKVGDRVAHTQFGVGTVAEVRGNTLAIDFDSGIRRRIMDTFVERK